MVVDKETDKIYLADLTEDFRRYGILKSFEEYRALMKKQYGLKVEKTVELKVYDYEITDKAVHLVFLYMKFGKKYVFSVGTGLLREVVENTANDLMQALALPITLPQVVKALVIELSKDKALLFLDVRELIFAIKFSVSKPKGIDF